MIYIFKLLVGWLPSGVDKAQAVRASLCGKFKNQMRYIFTELPSEAELTRYKELGIPYEQMLCADLFFTDHKTIQPSMDADIFYEKLKDQLDYDRSYKENNHLNFVKNDQHFAQVILDPSGQFVQEVSYYKNNCLLRTDYYTDGLLHSKSFVTKANESGQLYAYNVKDVFYNRDGSVAFEKHMEQGKPFYDFLEGENLSADRFLDRFVKNLNLSSKDKVIVDRPDDQDFYQPLFTNLNGAKCIGVFHADHDRNLDPKRFCLSYEYVSWVRYIDFFDCFVVSTDQQKVKLAADLAELGLKAKRIETIPAGFVEEIKKPMERRPYSIVTASRLSDEKKVLWIVKAAILAHERQPELQLDIYGDGVFGYEQVLQKEIDERNANSYIHLMGYGDVASLFPIYELYISASIKESFGLSMLEAVSCGDAMIAMDTRYGAALFAKDQRNGYLIKPHVYTEAGEEENIKEMADRIVDCFADSKRLDYFHKESYRISKDFLRDKVSKKWIRLLEYL